jgi:hypothetical protein
MKVFVLSAFSEFQDMVFSFAARWLRESAQLDPFGHHQLSSDPIDADIILFVEGHPGFDPYLLGVRHHLFWRRYSKKCFLYHDADYAVPILRGVYPSILKRDFLPDRCRGGGYIARLVENEFVRYRELDRTTVRWLYSFIGEANSTVRRAIFARQHSRGFVRDTSGRHAWELRGSEQVNYKREFANIIEQSAFVLCPGGCGPTSYRLFETMEMGRVPVILSDQWVAPEGVPWKQFSLRLPESCVSELDGILTMHESRVEEMGRCARKAWEQWFAKPVAFHRLVEACASIEATERVPSSAFRAWSSLARVPHRHIWLRAEYRRWKFRLRRSKGIAALVS